MRKSTAAKSTVTATPVKPVVDTPTIPAYKLTYKTIGEIERALKGIGDKSIEYTSKFAGSLRDATAICAIEYVSIQQGKSGGWTFDLGSLEKFIKGAMYPQLVKKSDEESNTEEHVGLVPKSTLFKNVNLACKIARLYHAGKSKIQIQVIKGERRIVAPWNSYEPSIIANGGKIFTNNYDELREIPGWAIDAQHEFHFGEKDLTDTGRIKPAEKTPDVQGHGKKAVEDYSIPELVNHLTKGIANTPDGKEIKGEEKSSLIDARKAINHVLGLAEIVEHKQVVEVKDCTFAMHLQKVRELMPVTESDWTKLSDEERDILSLIAERVVSIATPVKLAV